MYTVTFVDANGGLHKRCYQYYDRAIYASLAYCYRYGRADVLDGPIRLGAHVAINGGAWWKDHEELSYEEGTCQ